MTPSRERSADIAQARAFVVALNDHVERCTAKIEQVQAQLRVMRGKGKIAAVGTLASDELGLRNELYDIHRQLDRLHAAFPELRRDSRQPTPS